MKKTPVTPAPESAPAAKSKPGPKPIIETADPNLADEWAHLRAWWKEHGDLYNVKAIATRAGIDNIIVGYLLKGPETDPAKMKLNTKARTQRSYAATPERLTAIKKVLALHYQGSTLLDQ